MAVDKARQADIETAGHQFLMYSHEQQDLVIEQWELLQLLDVMFSKSVRTVNNNSEVTPANSGVLIL